MDDHLSRAIAHLRAALAELDLQQAALAAAVEDAESAQRAILTASDRSDAVAGNIEASLSASGGVMTGMMYMSVLSDREGLQRDFADLGGKIAELRERQAHADGLREAIERRIGHLSASPD